MTVPDLDRLLIVEMDLSQDCNVARLTKCAARYGSRPVGTWAGLLGKSSNRAVMEIIVKIG